MVDASNYLNNARGGCCDTSHGLYAEAIMLQSVPMKSTRRESGKLNVPGKKPSPEWRCKDLVSGAGCVVMISTVIKNPIVKKYTAFNRCKK